MQHLPAFFSLCSEFNFDTILSSIHIEHLILVRLRSPFVFGEDAEVGVASPVSYLHPFCGTYNRRQNYLPSILLIF